MSSKLEALGIKYEHPDTIVIYGHKYALALFEELGGLMPIGQLFRLVKREDGVITLERIYEKNTYGESPLQTALEDIKRAEEEKPEPPPIRIIKENGAKK